MYFSPEEMHNEVSFIRRRIPHIRATIFLRSVVGPTFVSLFFNYSLTPLRVAYDEHLYPRRLSTNHQQTRGTFSIPSHYTQFQSQWVFLPQTRLEIVKRGRTL